MPAKLGKGDTGRPAGDRLGALYADIEPEAMNQPLASLIQREPVHCAPDTPLRVAIETMHSMGIGSIVVCEEGLTPVGIFTVQDVLDRVTLRGIDLSDPIRSVMSGNLKTLSPRASAYEAAFAMAGQGIHHVVVVDEGKLAGVVSERDLFMRLGGFVRRVGRELRRAEDDPSLTRASLAIRDLAGSMLHQGVGPAQVTRLISTLNDVLTQQIIRLETRDAELGDMRWCFIEMGSAGRLEQTFSTDQDNGLIFEPPAGVTPDAVRERLLPIALRVNHALAECGIPLCRGGIMASNPRWCLSLVEWESRFADWINCTDQEALLNATIFFDFRAQSGDATLATELRRWLTSYVADNQRFLARMAQNAFTNEPPLGRFRDVLPTGDKEHPNSIDLKVNSITPFVDAGRILSLAAGVAATNTAQRLRESGQALGIPAAEVAAWVQGLEFLQRLRLKRQYALLESAQEVHNFLQLDSLNELERKILKESLRQARKLQSRLALFLGMTSYAR